MYDETHLRSSATQQLPARLSNLSLSPPCVAANSPPVFTPPPLSANDQRIRFFMASNTSQEEKLSNHASIAGTAIPPVTSPDLSLLKRISPEKLKFMLVPSEIYAPDRSFLFGALMCLRLFEKPGQIFDDVCAECFRRQVAIESNSSGRKQELLHSFSSHVVLLLSDWTDVLPSDFSDDASMGRLRVVLERICLPNTQLKRNVLLLVKNLTVKLERARRLTEQLSRLEAERVRRLVAGATASSAASAADIYAACPDPGAVARQLTRIELDWLQRIEPADVIDSFLLSSSKPHTGSTSSVSTSGSSSSPASKFQYQMDLNNVHIYVYFLTVKSCSALKAYVDWFNRLSYLVASEICLVSWKYLKTIFTSDFEKCTRRT